MCGGSPAGHIIHAYIVGETSRGMTHNYLISISYYCLERAENGPVSLQKTVLLILDN